MILIYLLLCSFAYVIDGKDILVAMPGVKPSKEDEYLCHGVNLNSNTYYITGFQPKADAQHAHHVLIYGCNEPGSSEEVWNCQEMPDKNDGNENIGPVCKSGMKLIYSWAMHAPGLELPADVSFAVGKNSDKPYLVLQAHYKDVSAFKDPNSKPDRSGISLQMQKNPTKKLAGLYTIVTDGSIPANSTVYMEAACSYTGEATLHPFAFRTHTHKLGKLVSGYVIHNKKWIEIGKKSPQLEQMFYPVIHDVTVIPGDMLAARCTMQNNGDKLVKIGPSRADEMCNFYIMYWVNNKDFNQLSDTNNQVCFSMGWPEFKWSQILDPHGIPDSASIMPGENKIVKEVLSEMKNQEEELNNAMHKEEKEIDKLFPSNFQKDSMDDTFEDPDNYKDAMNFNIDDFNNENGYF